MQTIKIKGKEYTNIGNFTIESDEILDKGINNRFICEFLEMLNRKQSEINIVRSEGKCNKENNLENPFYNDYGMCEVVGVYREKPFKWGEKEYDVTVEIGSRFDGATKPYFLAKMMLASILKGLNPEDIIATSVDDLFDFLLVYRFSTEFKKAYRQGFYKTYQRFERNDDRLKGSIDIARHIRLNMGMQNGKVAYSYRENTIDNSLNHLFLHTYFFIKKFYPSVVNQVLQTDREFKEIISRLLELCSSFSSTHIRSIMSKHLQKLAHPYFQGYESLRRVSIDILRRKGMAPFGEDDSDSKGPYMLFYVPDLWEEYLKSIFKGNMDFETQAEQYILFEGKNHRRRAIPDFLWKHKLVLDAKYRKVWTEIAKKNENDNGEWEKQVRDDIFQVLSYMYVCGCKKGGIICPIQDNKCKKKFWVKECTIKKIDDEDIFYILALSIPDIEPEDNFNSFADEIKKNENAFLKKILAILKMDSKVQISK